MKLLIIYHAGFTHDAKDIFSEYIRQGVELTVVVPKNMEFLPLFFEMKKARPNAVHVLGEYSSLHLTQAIFCRNFLYGKKVPVFAYAFQNVPFSSPLIRFSFSFSFLKRVVYKIFYPFIFWYHNNNVAGVSGSNRESLLNIRKIHPHIATKLIFWSVNTKKFFPKNSQECREELAIPQQVTVIGYIGRMLEEKGLDTLIVAASKLENCHVLLVGDGSYKERLVALVSSLGMKDRVFFRPQVAHSELIDYYNALDVFVLPSKTMPGWKEQYGRVLVEAMACGLPVVGSSSGAIPEVLQGYPKGFIFHEGNAQDLAEKIALAKNAVFPEHFDLTRFLYKFSVEHFVKEHITFYHDFLPHL